MDIYCVKCGEPVELDYLHDVAGDLAVSFDDVREAFFTRGCVALGGRCNERPDRERAMLSMALFDVLGDDVDGIAAEMDDWS
jgi:hypothetical protein